MEWGWGNPYTVHVNIYGADGTVAICHGGIEIGQGVNTKASHWCSEYRLYIPTIRIKEGEFSAQYSRFYYNNHQRLLCV